MTVPDITLVELDPPSVQVLEIGPDTSAAPVFVPGTGGAAGTLDELGDVTGTTTAGPGALLTKRADGLWHGRRPIEHLQAQPASVWGPIAHNLGRRPVAWSLFDLDGRECGQYVVQHLDDNTVRVSMDLPTAGVFRLI